MCLMLMAKFFQQKLLPLASPMTPQYDALGGTDESVA
jgi:hypothetical protein